MQNLYQEIKEHLEKGNKITLETEIKGTEGKLSEGVSRSLIKAVPEADEKGTSVYKVKLTRQGEKLKLTEPVLPEQRLIILGAGHIALYLSKFAVECGFQTYVADDRPEFANKQRFPGVKEVLCCPYAQAIQKLKITPYDFVVIVTRGHIHDADCLRVLLSGTQPAYMGMIGSRRRVQAQFEMLRQEGYSREYIERIFTPVGLKIGGVTPQEIAISILAEMIACKRLPEYGVKGGLIQNESDLEVQVMQTLANEKGPLAIATVMEALGSSPRKAGAKMLIKADGSICGTIGGGMAEGLAIREGLAILGTGRYKVLEVNMNGDVAAADGMVCGGSLKILIEDFQTVC